MRRFFTFAALCLCAAILFTIPASAQSCTTSTNYLQLTAGSPWAFKLSGFGVIPGTNFIAAVGTFTPRSATNARAVAAGPQGVVTSTISLNLNGTMYTTLMPLSGLFQLDWGPNGDCSSGTMMLASGTNPSTVRSVRFVLQAGGSRMSLVSTDNDGVVLTGEAERQ